jgi:putative ABC transport system substrate-binding protein
MAWPPGALAQSPTSRLIGFLRSTSAASSANLVASFLRGLKEEGFAEGQNLAIQYAFANGEPEKLAGLAVELVRQQPAAIVAGGNEALAAAKAATTVIPIVFALGDDPVRLGFVASLNHPGGNITGVSFETTDLVRKRVQFLRELLPLATKIGYLMNLNDAGREAEAREVEAAARSAGVQVVLSKAGNEAEIDAAFRLFARDGAEALLVGSGAFFFERRELLSALAAGHSIPAIYDLRNYVTAGGLVSYGPSIADAYRLVGVYVGRILRGIAASDLPVMQPTKFELVINRKASMALGLNIPSSILVRADDVIE